MGEQPTRDQWEAASANGTFAALYASLDPARVAVVSPSGDRTYGELSARANQLTRALRAGGLGAGDAVALLATNRVEVFEVYAACLQGGFRLTTINSHLTADEVAYIAADCGAAAFLVDAELAAVAQAVSVPGARVRLAFGGSVNGFSSYEDALAAEDPSPLDDPVLGGTMLYTSGTTGRPKGVYRARFAPMAHLALALYGYQPGDVHLCTGPLYHAAPLAFALATPMAAGVATVVMERWDEEDTLALIERHRVTHMHLVPTMFHRMLALPEDVRYKYDLSSLRVVLHGAAPCPVTVKHAVIEWLGPVVYEYYAATEGAGTLVDSTTWLARPGTVGRVAPGSLVVGDEDGVPLPPGEIGLVWLPAARGEDRFVYFGDDAKTDKAYRGERFTLGDMGYLDEDGFLFLTDRDANLIISGGVNIYPAEVDAVLLDHPAVRDAATIGVPDDDWGEVVLAVVELRDGVDATDALADELIALCRERLARFKCPRRVDFVEHLPREDNGKIYKRRLRDQYRVSR